MSSWAWWEIGGAVLFVALGLVVKAWNDAHDERMERYRRGW